MITSILDGLSGYKTYIIGIAMIVVGIYKNDVNLILEGFAVITGRAAIAKINS